jgi:8-oxo-dGTP diphosphatase
MPLFNVRVYGLLLNAEKQLLVSDELIRGDYITKLPGGGLEFGEGTRDCLRREFLEEMNLQVDVLDHFYTTDFFQMSAFNKEHQIISIYYLVKALETISAPLRTKAFDFDAEQLKLYETKREIESFRWIDWHDLHADAMTLPIDKVVVERLKRNMQI